MKVRIKYRNEETGKWRKLEPEQLEGDSIARFMSASELRIVAAVYRDDTDEAVLFICNREVDVDEYGGKGVSMHCDDIIFLIGSEVIPEVGIQILGGSILEVKTLREE